MVNVNKIKGLMAENGISQQRLAFMIGMSTPSLNAKLQEKREFTVSEAQKICEVLDISDVESYFFTRSVEK